MPRFSSLADDSFSGEKKKKEAVKLRPPAHISADGTLTYPLLISQTASVTAQKRLSEHYQYSCIQLHHSALKIETCSVVLCMLVIV